MSIGLALEALGEPRPPGVGPRGGRLEHPPWQPEARRAKLNVDNIQGEPGLHEFEDAARCGIQNEKPWHRMAAYMMLAGRTNQEIAESAQVSKQTVQLLRNQRWFQELLAVLGNETGQDILGAIRSHAHDAINNIAEIANADPKEVGSRTKLAANVALLEHAHGKPVQKILAATSHTVLSPQEEMASLNEELVRLRQLNKTAQ